MKPTDTAVTDTLARLSAGHAVIYLPGNQAPQPLTTAGRFHGRPFFMLGSVAHWIPLDLDARPGPLAVGFYQGPALQYYVTTAAECNELKLGDVVQQIEDTRAELGPDGIADAVNALDPLGDEKEK